MKRALAVAASVVVAAALVLLRVTLGGFGARVSGAMGAAAVVTVRRAIDGRRVLPPLGGGIALVPAGWFTALRLGAGTSC